MSIDHDGLGTSPQQPHQRGGDLSPGPASSGRSTPERASVALDETKAVATHTADAARDVAHEAAAKASDVAVHAREQFHTVIGQAQDELREQMGNKAGQAARSLRSLSDQLSALQSGQPEQASQLVGYMSEAQSKVSSLAERIDREGIQGVADDLTRFARRKPGVFLLGAVAAGFVAGRAMRAGTAASHEQRDASSGQPFTPGGTASSASNVQTLPPGTQTTTDWTMPPQPIDTATSMGVSAP